MGAVRRTLWGEHPRFAVATVIAAGATTAIVLAPFGVLELGVSGAVGTGAFAIAFVVIPGLAGGACGWYRLGVPAVAGSGLAPGVAFVLLVSIGAILDVGSFGGGDSPLLPFAITLMVPSVAAASLGFVLGSAVASRGIT